MPMTAARDGKGAVYALTTMERAAFGAGSLATATYAVVPGLVLLYYLTNVLGVAAGVAGLVVFLPKLLDLVYNPIVGRLSDATMSRWGPRRPWLAAGAISFPVAFIAVFCSPFTGVAAAWWVGITLALAGAGFSAFAVPYGVLPAELGAGAQERKSMTAWRMGFLGVAILAAGGVAPLLTAVSGGGTHGYHVMAVAMGCVIFVGACAALYSARRPAQATVNATADGAGSLRAALSVAHHNQRFSILLAVFLLVEVVIAAALAGLPYMAAQFLGSEEAIAPLFVSVLAPLLLTMPLWTRAAIRFGDRRCLQVALTVFGAGTCSATALPLLAESSRLPVACAVFAIAGTGFAGAQLLANTMLADTLAEDAGESCERRAGVLVGLWSAGETIAAAAGAGVYGVILGLTGFVSSTSSEVVNQPHSAQWGMVLGLTGTAAVCILTALALTTRSGWVGESLRDT
ncbi:MFS transporter [Mycolicibacterium neoaurum]|uniref:Thiomethylgalactoside permease II n=1 Tax=Mycolicibacterium neoaurum TaxID=1795 RepID=A0AAV2WDH3_MYCNE|nr:MFS transporter [Mycolicibacterium neoaurum]TLH60682.1 MFS transporter [Mycolicibacterium neoaurum]CDQ42337.1 Thiomethylgalactoside permease II [Mycolicibacterium neoaurum]